MAATLVVQAGTAAQKAEIVPQIIAGALVAALALDEAARHAPEVLATTATAKGDGWSLNGKKLRVIDGVGAKLLIVSAKEGGKPGLFLVDPSGPGVETTALPNPIDSRNAANVTLTNAPAERLGSGDASAAINAALDLGRVLLAAEQIGIADEAFDRTMAYIKEREQFDRKIGSFQALQHRAARLYARLELGQGIVLKALRALDENDPQKTAYATLAKGYVGKLARDVTVEAVQMHGGIGVTDDVDIGFFLKRARAANDLYGDDYFHTDKLAREHFGI
jgi:acyl-CoA dehydrogenase